MEILGIGPSEFFFIILIAIIILGPKDIQRTGKAIGRWLNQLVRSDTWKVFQKTSAELRNLPGNLMREANLEELQGMVGKRIEDANTGLQEMDKELRQTIDPRPRPPVSPTNPKPSTEPKTDQPSPNQMDTSPQPASPAPDPNSPPKDQTDTSSQPSEASISSNLSPSNQTEAAPQPSTTNPTDVNGEIKQNG